MSNPRCEPAGGGDARQHGVQPQPAIERDGHAGARVVQRDEARLAGAVLAADQRRQRRLRGVGTRGREQPLAVGQRDGRPGAVGDGLQRRPFERRAQDHDRARRVVLAARHARRRDHERAPLRSRRRRTRRRPRAPGARPTRRRDRRRRSPIVASAPSPVTTPDSANSDRYGAHQSSFSSRSSKVCASASRSRPETISGRRAAAIAFGSSARAALVSACSTRPRSAVAVARWSVVAAAAERVRPRDHAGHDQQQADHQQQRADHAGAARGRARLLLRGAGLRFTHRTNRRPGRAC